MEKRGSPSPPRRRVVYRYRRTRREREPAAIRRILRLEEGSTFDYAALALAAHRRFQLNKRSVHPVVQQNSKSVRRSSLRERVAAATSRRSRPETKHEIVNKSKTVNEGEKKPSPKATNPVDKRRNVSRDLGQMCVRCGERFAPAAFPKHVMQCKPPTVRKPVYRPSFR